MAQLVEQEKQASPQLAHYAAEYRRSLEQGPAQPRWVAQARESAIAQFERLGFPTTKLEQWRFTSVAPIAERTFTLANDGVARIDRQPIRAAQRSHRARRVRERPVRAAAVAARQAAERRADSRTRSGARLASRRWSSRISPSCRRRQTNAFTSLNTAFLRDGIVLFIPAASSRAAD